MRSGADYIKVRIGRMTYRLSAAGDAQRTYDIAATADAMMDQIAKRHPGLNQVSQAVLALVNAIGMMENFHLEQETAFKERDVSAIRSDELRAELDRLREQFWEMKKDLLYYQNLCEVYEKKLTERGTAEEDLDPARHSRRGRRVRVGDSQMTIEETLPEDESDPETDKQETISL